MPVVQFPDEVIRNFLARLDESPRFPRYLNALAYCARKDLDPSLLHGWWARNKERIGFDNCELDFIEFLNSIIVSRNTWAEKKAQLAKGRQEYENIAETCHEAIKDAGKSLLENVQSSTNFAKEHPEYQCVERGYHLVDLFETLFPVNNPLLIIAKWFQKFLNCGKPGGFDKSDYDGGSSLAANFGRENEKPAAFLIGSAEHQHLLDLASWVAERTANPKLAGVLHWSLNNEVLETPPPDIFYDACESSHAVFEHFMLHKEVDLVETESVICLLGMPLAMTARASGPAHLLPDFGFLGFSIFMDSGTDHRFRETDSRELINSWRDFFRRYRSLRVRYNNGRGFAGTDYFYQCALNAFRDDNCWIENDSNCISESIAALSPDISCLLDWFSIFFIGDTSFISPDFDEGLLPDDPFFASRVFLAVIKTCRAESLHELATSLLSYYLILVAITAEGNLDELNGLDEAIIESRRLPGYASLKQTLQIVCAFAAEKGRGVTQLKFEQLLEPSDDRVEKIISEGESETVEFKSTLRTNLHTGKHDRKIEHAVMKTIAAFLNKQGGSLLVGVDDHGQVLGLEADQFPNTDKLNLHLKNLIKDTMPDAVDQAQLSVVAVRGKSILLVECKRGEKPVFLKNRETRAEEFYVRRGPSTDQLGMREAFDYIRRNFPDDDGL